MPFTLVTSTRKLSLTTYPRSGVEVFLPTYSVVRQWTDRSKCLSLPLFPCYVFLRKCFEQRWGILATPGVRSFVMFGGRPTDASRPVPKTGKSGGLSFSAELDAECRWEGPLPDPAAVSGSGNAASA